jgi:1-acyl-sn-glycerol-3-phosphate acyltransferase
MPFLRALARLAALLLVTAVLFPLGLLSRVPRRFGAREAGMRWGARVQSWWGRICLPLMGVRIERRGEAPPEQVLLAANHLSYLDIIVLGALFPCRFVAKSEIAGWPLVGLLSRSVGTIFVRQARRRDLRRVGELMDETLHAGVSVVLFPEGRATRGVRIEKLHSSLFETVVRRDIPCWAVTLGYRTPRDPWGEAWTICWWGGMGMPRHLWRLLATREIVVTLHCTPVETEGGDRKSIAADVRQALETGFRPIRQHPVPSDCPWPELAALGPDEMPPGF